MLELKTAVIPLIAFVEVGVQSQLDAWYILFSGLQSCQGIPNTLKLHKQSPSLTEV